MTALYLPYRFSGALILAAVVAAPPGAGAMAADATTDAEAVVVTATRQATRANEVIADVTVLDRAAIEQAGSTTLPALLARQPGLHVVDNGGAGKSASIFIRGTSPGHALLLIDGVPFGSATTGTPSLHNLPLSQIERIEILRGPASSLYGSDAVGGVIQVFTRRGKGPLRVDAFAGAGSHRTAEASAGVSGGDGAWSYSFGVAHYATAGFNVAADPLRYQLVNGLLPSADADGYRNTSANGRLSYQLADGHEAGITLLDASSRNAYDSGGVSIDAHNEDRTRVYSVYLRNRIGERWTSTLRWGSGEDNSTNFAPARTQFATTQVQSTWQNDVRLPLGSLLLAFENLDQAVVSTTNYSLKNRTVRSAIAGYQGSLDKHSWQTSLRRDDNSQFGGRTTGALGYGYRFAAEWLARLAMGTAFKAPSFNQLYFPGFGNAALKPEEARNREIGVNWERGTQNLNLTYFDNRITNLIAGVPVGNIGKARITGTSIGYGLVQGAWNVNGGLDLMRPVDEANGNRLQRRPAEMLKFGLGHDRGEWRAGGEVTAVGRRYDTTTQGRAMGGYAVANLHVAWQFAPRWSLEGRLNNVFDRVYENAWSYAVPGREAFVGVRYAPR